MSQFDVSDIVSALRGARDEWRDSQKRSREPGSREFPSRDALAGIVESLKGALFPMRLGPPDLRHESEDFYVGHTLDSALQSLWTQARLELRYNARHQPRDAGGDRCARPRPRCATSRPRCPAFAACSTATCSRPSRATRRRAASTRCCCAIPASWR